MHEKQTNLNTKEQKKVYQTNRKKQIKKINSTPKKVNK